jgi:transcriptional regulator with XRE-family HTH domain
MNQIYSKEVKILRKWMAVNEISRQDLETQVGLSKSLIDKVLSGRNEMSEATKIRLENRYQIDFGHIELEKDDIVKDMKVLVSWLEKGFLTEKEFETIKKRLIE